jgi:hypothetical protein
LLGRLEDIELKGVDLAAAAIGIISRDDRFRGATEPTLVLRGATPGTSKRLLDSVRGHAGANILCTVKDYTSDEERVREDIARASVVLMPSRVEGFGLVALEALAIGVPILVSQRSGFGELLLERIQAEPELEFAKKYVVDVRDTLANDAARWADAIRAVLEDRQKAFEEMAVLRGAFQRTDYWQQAITDLFTTLPIPSRDPNISPDVPPDLLQMARRIADADPVVAIAMATSVLEREIELSLTSRAIAKPGLHPALYTALIGNRGFLQPRDADLAKELLNRRNMAVHGRAPGLDLSQAEEHLQSVERLIKQLRAIK